MVVVRAPGAEQAWAPIECFEDALAAIGAISCEVFCQNEVGQMEGERAEKAGPQWFFIGDADGDGGQVQVPMVTKVQEEQFFLESSGAGIKVDKVYDEQGMESSGLQQASRIPGIKVDKAYCEQSMGDKGGGHGQVQVPMVTTVQKQKVQTGQIIAGNPMAVVAGLGMTQSCTIPGIRVDKAYDEQGMGGSGLLQVSSIPGIRVDKAYGEQGMGGSGLLQVSSIPGIRVDKAYGEQGMGDNGLQQAKAYNEKGVEGGDLAQSCFQPQRPTGEPEPGAAREWFLSRLTALATGEAEWDISES